MDRPRPLAGNSRVHPLAGPHPAAHCPDGLESRPTRVLRPPLVRAWRWLRRLGAGAASRVPVRQAARRRRRLKQRRREAFAGTIRAGSPDREPHLGANGPSAVRRPVRVAGPPRFRERSPDRSAGPRTATQRVRGRICTSKISSTPLSNSNVATVWPEWVSTTPMPHFSPSRCSAIGTPPKTAVSRIRDSPTNASGPWNAKPRVKPGMLATRSRCPFRRSTASSEPCPESRTHKRPSWIRGECGMAMPPATTWPLATSRTHPLWFFVGRQPAGAFDSARSVT